MSGIRPEDAFLDEGVFLFFLGAGPVCPSGETTIEEIIEFAKSSSSSAPAEANFFLVRRTDGPFFCGNFSSGTFSFSKALSSASGTIRLEASDAALARQDSSEWAMLKLWVSESLPQNAHFGSGCCSSSP